MKAFELYVVSTGTPDGIPFHSSKYFRAEGPAVARARSLKKEPNPVKVAVYECHVPVTTPMATYMDFLNGQLHPSRGDLVFGRDLVHLEACAPSSGNAQAPAAGNDTPVQD